VGATKKKERERMNQDAEEKEAMCPKRRKQNTNTKKVIHPRVGIF
jgi:hypothetical protein